MALLLAPEIIETGILAEEGTAAAGIETGAVDASSSSGLLSGIGNIIKSPVNLISGLFGLELVKNTLQGGDELSNLSKLPSGILGATNNILSILSNPIIGLGLAGLLIIILLRR
jgi:hypothetical protein